MMSRVSQVSTLSILIIIVALVVMVAWLMGIEEILSLIPEAPTMKFNSALLFFISATGCILRISKKNLSILNYIIGTFLIIFSLSTLFQYFSSYDLGLDSFLIVDNLTQEYPGRMSRATALCFTLFGIALISTNSSSKTFRIIGKSSLSLIALIAVLAVLTFILQSVSESKVLIFNSMALHTALSFFILSLALSLSTPKNTFVDLFSGSQVGSKLARSILPFLVIFPLLLSFSLIHLVDTSDINSELGITIYTVIYASVALIYSSWVAVRLNREAEDRKHLEKSLVRMNKELKASIRFKKQLIRTSPETILILNLNDQNVRYINKDVSPEEGLTRDNILGTPLTAIATYVHPRDRKKVLDFHLKLLKSAEDDIHDIEIRLKLKGQNWEWFSVRGKIFQKRDEHWVDEYVLLIRNVNQQKETQEALLSAEKFSIMGEVARTLAHELRNPITSIGMATDVLKMKLPEAQQNGEMKYFTILKNSTKTLNDLVSNLLNSSNYTETVLEKHDLSNIIDKTLEKAADRIYLSGMEIDRKYQKSHMIFADSEKLEIALLNIIVNASEAVVPDEGIITIETIEEEKEYLLRISDNGHGMEESQLESLFDAFYTTKKTGIGVGLNAVKTILEEHDSRIEVDSELGKGTSFNIFFPKIA